MVNLFMVRVQTLAVRAAAHKAGKALVAIVATQAFRGLVMPVLLKGIAPKENWQSKLGGLALLDLLTQRAPAAVSACLPEIVPAMTEIMADAKPQVKVWAVPHSLVCMLRPTNNRAAFCTSLPHTGCSLFKATVVFLQGTHSSCWGCLHDSARKVLESISFAFQYAGQ